MTEKNTTRSTRPCGARRLKSGKDRRETESKNDVLEKELEGEIHYLMHLNLNYTEFSE